MSILPYVWLGLSVLLLALGLTLPYEITFWLAIDAFIVMIIAFAGASPIAQVITAVVLGVLFCFLSKRLAFASLRPLRDTQTIRANPDELIGRQGIVVISVHGSTKRGLVNFSGEKWVAEAERGVQLAQGDEVEVVSLKGQRLVVKPV